MNESKTIPSITGHTWPNMAIPEMEIQSILTFLAYKTNKPVTFRWYTEDEGYCENSISVRIATSAGGLWKAGKTDTVRLAVKIYVLSEKQVAFDIGIDVPEEKRILDDDFLTLAYVDHNRIIVPIELTAADNQEATALLAYVIERAIGLLDFSMTEKLLEQREKLSQQFYEVFTRGVKRRIADRENLPY